MNSRQFVKLFYFSKESLQFSKFCNGMKLYLFPDNGSSMYQHCPWQHQYSPRGVPVTKLMLGSCGRDNTQITNKCNTPHACFLKYQFFSGQLINKIAAV